MAITKMVAGLYTTDGTTLTQVATTAEVTTGFLATGANTRTEIDLDPATVVLNPGQVYYVALLVDATTAGSTQGFAEAANVVSPTAEEGPPPKYTLAGQTSLGATHAISGLTAAYDPVPGVWIKGTAAA